MTYQDWIDKMQDFLMLRSSWTASISKTGMSYAHYRVFRDALSPKEREHMTKVQNHYQKLNKVTAINELLPRYRSENVI